MSTTETMTVSDAILICDGVCSASDVEFIQAWQLLVDTGTCWQLEGFFGRTANMLIARGHIQA